MIAFNTDLKVSEFRSLTVKDISNLKSNKEIIIELK